MINVTDETFATDVIEASKKVPVLVDVWADWCTTCKAMMPVVASIASEYGDRLSVVKVEAEESGRGVVTEYGIRSLPTFILFVNGEVVDRWSGPRARSAIEKSIAPYVVSEI
ncbi:MAG: thioredoxin family protein [Cetobacterium sp.]